MKLERTCTHCGTTFTIWPSAVLFGYGKYCNKSCVVADKTIPAVDRFWKFLDRAGPDDCWLWTGAVNHGGYGIFTDDDRRQVRIHRFSWTLHHGPIPTGIRVCHSCDVRYLVGDITYRRCGNPIHLFLGTDADNIADRDAKGRTARGDRITIPRDGRPARQRTVIQMIDTVLQRLVRAA